MTLPEQPSYCMVRKRWFTAMRAVKESRSDLRFQARESLLGMP
jgi:hypothetical protein